MICARRASLFARVTRRFADVITSEHHVLMITLAVSLSTRRHAPSRDGMHTVVSGPDQQPPVAPFTKGARS